MRTPLCDTFGIDVPIFAFSHCRDVVAAVSKAGGFGVLGALAFSPEQLEIELQWIDEHIDGKPYGVDIVMPASSVAAAGGITKEQLEKMIPERHKQFIEKVLTEYEVPPLTEHEQVGETLLGWTPEGGRAHVDVALQHPIKLLVNALGPPPKDVVDVAHRHGILVAALVGSKEQAIKQAEQGVDIIVAQGWEAGGHTGDVSTLVLVPEVVDAVAPRPVLAAGGIGSGRQAAAAMCLGAQGVWTGSIWLTVAEADTAPTTMKKLLGATSRDTVRSRAFTGKPARQLRTAWTDAWEGPDSPGTLPMPLQYMAVAEANRRIWKWAAHPERSRAHELAGFPVGQIVGSMKEVLPSSQVVYDLVEGFVDTVAHLQGLLEAAEKAAEKPAK
jgi:NAD(P)H-dependent flavin oxidoreductase YrpB (nitropropane dioxygenase family)